MVDITSESGARLHRELQDELIVWLTTVRSDGQPQPVPVWFLWDGQSFLIYSQPDTQKLRNIRRSERVALNLNSDMHGGRVVRFNGRAEILEGFPPADQVPEMIEKYRQAISAIGMTPESFAASYSVPIRVTPNWWRF